MNADKFGKAFLREIQRQPPLTDNAADLSQEWSVIHPQAFDRNEVLQTSSIDDVIKPMPMKRLSNRTVSPATIRVGLTGVRVPSWEKEAPSEPKCLRSDEACLGHHSFLAVVRSRVVEWRILAIAFCCMAGSLSGATFGNFIYTDNGTYVTITGFVSQPVGALSIPGAITGKSVAIGSSAFANCTGVTSLSISAGVFRIDTNSFWACSGITSVTIPSSVSTIGAYAFYSCTGLTSVTIPASVSTIGDNVFSRCSGLTSLTISNGVKSIGDNAFWACRGLTSVAIPSSVTSIMGSSFSSCSKLASIVVDAANPSYSTLDGVLVNKSQTTLIAYPAGKSSVYTIPVGVTAIGNQAFQGSTGLTSVTIPYGITSIGSSAFFGCNLTNITIPASVTSIGASAIAACNGLTIAEFLGNAPTMGIDVFNSAAINFTVAFYSGATGFTSPTWNGYPSVFQGTLPPGSLQVSIGPAAALTAGAKWQVDGGVWQTTGTTISGLTPGIHTVSFKTASGGWDAPANMAITVYAKQTTSASAIYAAPGSLQVNITPSEAVTAGASWLIDGTAWVSSGSTIPGLIQGTHSVSFRTVSGWTAPDDVAITIIANQKTTATANYYLSGALQVNMAPSEALSAGARWRVDGGDWQNSGATISKLPLGFHTISFSTMPSSWSAPASISAMVYANQTTHLSGTYSALSFLYTDNGDSLAVTSCPAGLAGVVEIPVTINGKPVTRIEDKAFYNCNKLISVTIPYGVAGIGNQAFEGCAGLTSISIPGSVTSIGNQAFQGCIGLPSVTIPGSVTSLGTFIFYNCTGLISATIATGVTDIGESMFQGCTALASISIPNSVTTIGFQAFNSCSNLASVTIPDSVTTIGGTAFGWCDGLTSITIPASVTTIGSQLLWGCSKLTSISVDATNPNYSSMAGVLFNKSQTSIIEYPGGKSGAYAIPATVASIEIGAFYNCSGLTSVTFPPSVIAVTNLAFAGCTGLTSVAIPGSVASIGSQAFAGCTGLTSVTIPASVTSIMEYAFYACSGLNSAEFIGSAPTMGVGVFASTAYGFTVKYHSGTTGFTSPTWSGYKSVNIGGLPPTITTPALPAGTVGIAYNQIIQATGGTPPYTWTLLSGSLSPELVLGSNGAITGTPKSAATFNFTVKLAGSDSLFTTANFSITIDSPYSAWQGGGFTAADIATGLTTMTADFENDGLANLLEYAFATDPKAANASPLAVSFSGNNLQISFPCNSACTDITYTVQASPTLDPVSWADIAKSTGGAATVPVGSLSSVSDSGTGLRTVTVTDSTAIPPGDKKFLRVKVTVP